MKLMIVAATAVAVLLGGMEVADAKSERSSGGGSSHFGGSHSSGSRSSGTHRVRAPRAAKAKRDYVVVKCKTSACLKKHPSGVYGFVPKAKKQ